MTLNSNKITIDFTKIEAMKITNQNKYPTSVQVLNSINNNSALDRKFVIIETSISEKNNIINNSISNSSKKISQQSNKKEFYRFNNQSNSNNNSRRHSNERSKGKTKINNGPSTTTKTKNKNENEKQLDFNEVIKKLNKKEIPLNNFTFKPINIDNNSGFSDSLIKTKQQVFSPKNLKIISENFSAKNILKESTGDKSNAPSTVINKISLYSKTLKNILPKLPPSTEKNIKLDSKTLNNTNTQSKKITKIRENSAMSKISNSNSREKEKKESSGDFVKALIENRIDTKGKRRDGSSKRLNSNSNYGNENQRILTLNSCNRSCNQKVHNLPVIRHGNLLI